MFSKILVANRGEIAVRIAQTIQEMGCKAVAVFSEADAHAKHVAVADEAYALDGYTPAESYLRGDKIIDIARRCSVDAIHPGYGFLSENEHFARAVAEAGITFIGPSPEVIRDMGDKIVAKKTLGDAGVPLVPGWTGDENAPMAKLREEADRIGYPVMVKAAAGGGGKGMRVVEAPAAFEASVEAARREARNAFGDARVFLEKFLVRPRHVEFQIFGDHAGNVVHLFDRECSTQRRHQKILEESPSPFLTPELRRRMGEAAVAAAQTLGYTNAGTVEFVVSETGEFYFLEVNTRLQVEHPVTELVVRHDLVRAQILVAAGEPMPFTQESLKQSGHAIECRVYAEDPARGFLPSTGVIDRIIMPVGPGVRVDCGVTDGAEVTVHYDPMLAKVIVWGGDRPAAVEKMRWALRNFVVLGVQTNIEFLQELLDHPDCLAGNIHTQWLDAEPIRMSGMEVPDEAFIAAAWGASQFSGARKPEVGEGFAGSQRDAWESSGHFRVV